MPKIIQNLENRLIAEAKLQVQTLGYGAVTIRSIAKSCGVGVGTVYNYFPSKEALVATYLLEAAGIELPPYYRFLKEMEQQIPVFSALGYYSLEAQQYQQISEASGTEALWLNNHAVTQYNNLFDGESRDKAFFAAYLNQQ